MSLPTPEEIHLLAAEIADLANQIAKCRDEWLPNIEARTQAISDLLERLTELATP